MPPFSTPNNILHAMSQPDLDHSFMQQHEDLRKAELVTSAWNNAQLYSIAPLASTPLRLNVKTHVFKKELQEYIPTQIEDRLRIETIIYVELSIIDQATGALANTYDYVRLPKDLFLTQADKVMSAEEMATKRILNITATLQCPSNGWQEEKEACLRCARRMSAKSDATESRIMHMLPELHRTQEGDELLSFRSGIANIQFKINCYCGHKREKEGFVIRFDSQSDASISSHVTLPLMFYHQNKNRIASRALAAAAKAQAKAEQQDQQLSVARNIVKSVNSKLKREPRNHGGRGPIGENHQIPSPPNSLIDSPTQTWSSSPEMDEFMDSSDLPFTVPSPPPPDPALSLFHDNSSFSQEIQPKPQAMITHMTPNSGPTRGGTLVTIHGSNFTVGEVVYVSFGQTLVPIFPQRDHILECFTPAVIKADTVPVFVVEAANDAHAAASSSQITFTYVDDNEKELIKLALQRMMNITARMNGPLENVLHRANDFALWNDLLEGDSLDGSSNVYQNLEKMVLQSFELVDPVSSGVKNCEHLSTVNSTGHTMLHLAVALQYQALVKDLLDRGVDVELTDKNGMTALNWARHVNNDALVALLSGMEVVVKDVSSMVVSKDLSGALVTSLTKGVEVAEHMQSLENPSVGLAHSPPSGSSGIVLHDQVDGSPPGHIKFQGIASGHDDPPMKIQWEGFGQGPGPADASVTAAGSKILDVNKTLGLFDGSQMPDESEHVDIYQAPQDLPDRREVTLAKGQPPQDATSAIPIPLVHKYDASLMSAPNQDHSPVPQRRLPIAGVVVQSAGVSQEREMNIPILPVAGAICPIGGPTSVRQPVGDLDHRAPCGQGVVADQGSPGSVKVPFKDAHLPPWSQTASDVSVGVPGTRFGHQSAGIQQHQSLSQEHQSSRIQSTSRLDVPVAGVRIPIQHNNDVIVRQDGDVVDAAVIDHYSPTPPGVVGGVVVMDDVDNDVVGSSTVVEGMSAKQAAVQSSRFDVSEHPLFLGGLPVLPRDISRVKPPRTEIVQDQAMEREHIKDEEQDGDIHDEVRRA